MKKYSKLYIIFLALSGMLLVAGCGHKSAPQTTDYNPMPVVQSDCDSLIKAAMNGLKPAPARIADPIKPSNNGMEKTVIQLAAKLNDCQKENVALTEQLKRAAAPVTIYNGKVKNSFNQTEITNLKRSIQLLSDSLIDARGANLSLQEKLKQKGGSVNGDNNTVSNDETKKGAIKGDGNTQDNSKKLNWIWIFLAGYLCSVIVRRVIVPIASRHIPFLSFLNKIA